MRARTLTLGAVLALALVLASLLALPSFGIAWDEGLGDLFFGHRNLDYLLTADPSALDFTTRSPVDGDGRTHPDLFLSPLRTRPWEHWPVMATLSALSCTIFSRTLALLDPVDAHHLAAVLVLGALVPLALGVAAEAWGMLAGLVATLTMLLHPRLLAAAWFDLKDTGSAAFGTAFVLAAWMWLNGRQWRWLLVMTATLGLALGTKANALFLPLPVALYALLGRPSLPAFGRREALHLMVVGGGASLLFVASWPWLWPDPIARLGQNVAYFATRGGSGDRWPNPWPILTALGSWPLGTLPLVIVGGAVAARSLRNREASLGGLCLLAAALPLARLSAPGVLSFDGIRHALEFLPAAALLAGAGARTVLARANGRLASAALAVCLLEPAVEIAAVHPLEGAAMSPLVGGIAGARALGFAGVEDYWATGYRRALRWVDVHAEPGAAVAAGVAGHLLLLEAPLRLAPDRILIPASSPFRPDPGPEALANALRLAADRPFYLMYITRREWYSPLVLLAEQQEPLYIEGPPSDPLLKVVRFRPSSP